MSNQIVAQFEDPRINDIRKSVNMKNDAIPFLLFPVRIETRFMKVEKQQTEEVKVSIEGILEELAHLHVLIINTQWNVNGVSIRVVADEIFRLTDSFKNLNTITLKEKGWLKQLTADIKEDIQILAFKSGPSYTGEMSNLWKQFDALEKAIASTGHARPPLIPEVRTIIDSLVSIDSQVGRFTERKSTPYINVKNKKDLSRYILSVIENAKFYFIGIGEGIRSIESVEKNQRDRIKRLLGDIKRKLETASRNIPEIHKDGTWKSFVEVTVQPEINEAQRLIGTFESEYIPFLENLPRPQHILSGDLFFQGIKTLIKIKKFNHGPKDKYETLKRFKKDLSPRIQKFAGTIAIPIAEEKSGHTELLKNLYSAISIEMGSSEKKINAYQPKNGPQGIGKSKVSSFSKEAKDIIGAFAGQGRNFPEPVYLPKAPVPSYELWVRIYPDDIHMDTHEEKLTQKEKEAGEQFWKVYWAASDDKDLEIAAWKTLCTALGTTRASWVARSLDPRNIAANVTTFKNKPSANTVDAINIGKTATETLKLVKLDQTPFAIFKSFKDQNLFATVNDNLLNLQSELSSTSNEQDYLIDKLKVSLVQIASILNELISKAQTLSSGEISILQSALAGLQTTVGTFNAIQTKVQEIVAVDHRIFVDNLQNPLTYPEVLIKEKDWSKAPTAQCLPDNFVVITQNAGSFSHITVGKPVPANLQVGLDPSKFEDNSVYSIDSSGNLIIDEGLRWMTDFSQAVEKGMGIKLTITKDEYNEGFEKVIVIGVKNSDSTASQKALEQLINSHIYSVDGLEFLKVGTPTNNTQDKKSGFSPESDVEHRFDIEIKNVRYSPQETNPYHKTDGKYLCDALGISNDIMQYAGNSGNLEIANSFAIHKSLWHSTIGHFMEEMFDRLFAYDNIRRTENFFTHYCSGRGIVPSIRIGAQPYGILATTAFSRLQLYDSMPTLTKAELELVKPWGTLSVPVENKLQKRFELRLHSLLKLLNEEWTKLRESNVIHSGNLHEGDAQQRFVEMLGLTAVPQDYIYRYSINIAKGLSGNGVNFIAEDIFGPIGLMSHFKELMLEGYFYPSFNFPDEFDTGNNPSWKVEDMSYSRIRDQFTFSRIFNMRMMSSNFPVSGNKIDLIAGSDTDPLSNLKNSNHTYLDWLINSRANEMLGSNEFDNPAKIPSDTLLFTLLRQSVLQAYQEAALTILQSEGILSETQRRDAGNKFNYFRRTLEGNRYKHLYTTKWHYLFKNLSDLKRAGVLKLDDNNSFFNHIKNNSYFSVANYLDQVRSINPSLYNASHQPFFNKLKDVREAVSCLKRIPTANLEILLAEHLGLASYRLDSWLFGLVHQRLQKQRSLQKNGIFIGAYGYVENLKRSEKNLYTQTTSLSEFKLKPEIPVYQDKDSDGFIHAPSISQAITAAVLRNAYKNNIEEENVQNRLSVNLSSSRVRAAMQLIEGIRNGQEVGALLGFQFERGLHEKFNDVELDKFIQPFRKAYPLKQKVNETTGEAPSYVSLVVNGSMILDEVYDVIKWLDPVHDQQNDMTVGEALMNNNFAALPAKIKATIDSVLTTEDDKGKIYKAIIDEIDRMADAYDALGDIAISESVYQMVQGNHMRAAAVLSSLGEGKNLPDPQVIETNRTGTVVTQRVVLNFAAIGPSVVPNGWESTDSIRFQAEPSLNKWLGDCIGDALKIKYIISVRNSEGGIIAKEKFDLTSLGIQPIDLFCLPGGEEELKELLVSLYRRRRNEYFNAVLLDTNERGEDWSSDDRSVSEIFLLIKPIVNILGNSRYCGADEIQMANDGADRQNPGNFILSEFEARVSIGVQSLRTFIDNVEKEPVVSAVLNGDVAIADLELTDQEYDSIYNLLYHAFFLGIPNALSVTFPLITEAQTNVFSQKQAALQHLILKYKEAVAREKSVRELENKLPSYPVAKIRVEKLGELAKAVFGKTFHAIPQYTPYDTINIVKQLTLAPDLRITRHRGLVAVEEWIGSISKVRKKMYDVQMWRQITDVYDNPLATIEPVQLPYQTGDYWMGQEYPSDFIVNGDKLSLILINDAVLNSTGVMPVCGLIIDEWHEVIPDKEVTSGIVFNYNQPNASAPQSVLLAVTPSVTNQWEWDDLVYTIIDTIELAKNRAVEPDHLDKSFLNQVLPAIVAEVVPPQTTGEGDNPLGVQVVMDFSNVKAKQE